MSNESLTTGRAARLCSVKPDTVLKWIKKGRLRAVRTAGGHFRVEEREVLRLLARNGLPDLRERELPVLCSRPMRCWEYMSNSPGETCKDCIVYQVHAVWCFRMVALVRGAGHGRHFCVGPCQDCPYYRRVQGLPANVLVVTRDEALIQDLAKRESKSVAFRFARRGYDAAAIIAVFRPAFIVLDQAVLDNGESPLLEALASDQRAAGARILLALRKGSVIPRPRHPAVMAVLEEPFSPAEIVALIDRVPIELLPADDEGVKRG